MQGRLLPKYKKNISSSVGYWENEFPIASKLISLMNLFLIIINQVKPFIIKEGLKKSCSEKLNNIKVKSICADYFMEAPS